MTGNLIDKKCLISVVLAGFMLVVIVRPKIAASVGDRNPWVDINACAQESHIEEMRFTSDHAMGNAMEVNGTLEQVVYMALTELANPYDTFPWVSNDWWIEEHIAIPELGIVDGMKVTFCLRQDVTWHDGKPVTAYDCVNIMDLLMEYRPVRYSSTWADMVYAETEGPYRFTVYFDTPIDHSAHVAETALLTPKHVADIVGNFFDWNIAFQNYSALGLGSPPAKYPLMKQVVGCGDYVFEYYDENLSKGRVVEYDEFFANVSVLGSIIGEWWIESPSWHDWWPEYESTEYMGLVQNLQNTSTTVEAKIYEDDILKNTTSNIALDPWQCCYLGPYTTAALYPGPHNIRIEVYGPDLLHTYEHDVMVTVMQDVTTKSGKIIDFLVDIDDITLAVTAFGSYSGRFNWDPDADIWGEEQQPDWLVDIDDVAIIAIEFGWHA